MPRQMKMDYPGPIYHILCRGDRPEAINHDDHGNVDRQDFIETLAQTHQNSVFKTQYNYPMGKKLDLLMEIPKWNFVAGMRLLISNYRGRPRKAVLDSSPPNGLVP